MIFTVVITFAAILSQMILTTSGQFVFPLDERMFIEPQRQPQQFVNNPFGNPNNFEDSNNNNNNNNFDNFNNNFNNQDYDGSNEDNFFNDRRRPTPRPRLASRLGPTTTSIPLTTTTAQPLDLQTCLRNCPVTSEYNPLCGTDGQNYNNRNALRCSQRCGINVQIVRPGPCFPRTL